MFFLQTLEKYPLRRPVSRYLWNQYLSFITETYRKFNALQMFECILYTKCVGSATNNHLFLYHVLGIAVHTFGKVLDTRPKTVRHALEKRTDRGVGSRAAPVADRPCACVRCTATRAPWRRTWAA